MIKHFSIICLLLSFFLTSCRQDENEGIRGLQSEAFYERYNNYIISWLQRQIAEEKKALAELEERIGAATDSEEKAKLEANREPIQRNIERYEFRLSLGDYFNFASPDTIPDGLVWEDGMDEPEIGSPKATKGGAFRYFVPSFPPTLRGLGANSNNSIRGELYDNIEIYLTDLHPDTQRSIPGVAREWALGPDGRTVFFRLDPEAKFNDGHPIVAEDFLTFSVLRLSDFVDSIYYKQYLREQFAQFTVYDDQTLAVTLPEPKPVELMAYYCSIPPAATHFYDDFGPDYEERYQWLVPPSTAAYRVKPEDVIKGDSITLTRVDDWWLKDRKYYRYRFNADRLSYRVIRDIPKAWELFRAGELDYFPITLPEFYYDKSEFEAVFDGYIERTTWYNRYPRIPWGLYLNVDEAPLDDKNVRRGVAHAMNWQKVIDIEFRGDASRLPGFTTGYGDITNPDIQAKPFSVQKAREYFAAAGYTEEAKDGILMKENGERLEIELTYANVPQRARMMLRLMQEAKKAGLSILLDGRDGTSAYRKGVGKEHQMLYTGWGFIPPVPAFYEYFHSRNAFDEQGNRKAQTNNVFSYASDRMDTLTEGTRNARTREEFIRAAHEIQEIVAEEDLFIPGYMIDFSRVATWRWVRWPMNENTHFAPPLAYIPMESYVYWIDEEMREDTLAARREGRTFPEVDRLVDDYRESAEQEAEPEEEEANEPEQANEESVEEEPVSDQEGAEAAPELEQALPEATEEGYPESEQPQAPKEEEELEERIIEEIEDERVPPAGIPAIPGDLENPASEEEEGGEE
ncbi:MAG: extracellular solute-binding protein [Verrucomicrobiota bacterium JB023]|nr:extracellular solute-binding protein [Verrucomicrobiota bacterium JB023]